MTQYNSLNVKLSNSQLNKLKSAIKNETYGDDYTTGCLLDYPCFIETYKMIAVD